MAEPDSFDSMPTRTWAGPPQPSPGEFPVGETIRQSGSGSVRQVGWQAPEPEHLQSSFPQYEIRRVLGRGGMGAVYQGWQRSLDRMVAIKILPPDLEDGGANFAERFQREAKAMARFSHPGIVTVFDAGQTPDGLFYFVMEYIEGTDVQQMVRENGPLPPEHALAITAHVCDALAYAHRQGVIHRDIKPANIMVDAEGNVKVADFGLAKVATEDSAAMVTGSHISMGTMDFMAPEAIYGMSAVDHRADLYAVGVMLYQMLTGEVPRGMFDPPSVHQPGLDVRYDEIVKRAMQKNPDKRYASATEIRSDLDQILSGRVPHQSAMLAAPPPEPPVAVLDPVTPLKPKGLPLIWIASGIVGLLALLAGGAIYGRKKAPLLAPAAATQAPAHHDNPPPTTPAVGFSNFRPEAVWQDRLPPATNWSAGWVRVDGAMRTAAKILFQPFPEKRTDSGVRVRFRMLEDGACLSLDLRKDKTTYIGSHYVVDMWGAPLEFKQIACTGKERRALAELAAHPLLYPGEVHTAEFYAVGNQLTFYLDGKLLGTAEDSTLQAGYTAFQAQKVEILSLDTAAF